MKPTTYRAGFQRLVAVGVFFRESFLASAGGGLFRPLGGAGLQRFIYRGDSMAHLARESITVIGDKLGCEVRHTARLR